MRKYNGHPILDDMPAPRLFVTGNEEAVRIALSFKDSPKGTADIYVHKNCVTYSQGEYIDATFDIILIDDEYVLYYPMKNPDTGKYELRGTEKKYSLEEICVLAEKTKVDYAKHPIKRPRSLLPKFRPYVVLDEYLGIEPKGMLTKEYLEPPKKEDPNKYRYGFWGQ